MAIDEDLVRLRLRCSLLDYLERNMEHHDEFVGAVKSGTIHDPDTMMRVADLRAKRDAALGAHLDQLAEAQRRGAALVG
ncbi:MAG: hypothetical protein ABSF84_00665 [Acidimicrobiales bacterium]